MKKVSNFESIKMCISFPLDMFLFIYRTTGKIEENDIVEIIAIEIDTFDETCIW